MRCILIFGLVFLLTLRLYSQEEYFGVKKTNCITIGLFQGGGSVVGVDVEVLLTDHIGIQAGTGIIGCGAGINYHFEPSIKSSFISLQYWHQGFGEFFAQNALGPTFVYRGKRWFTFQTGLGATMSKGPLLPENYNQPMLWLMLSIGGYLPF